MRERSTAGLTSLFDRICDWAYPHQSPGASPENRRKIRFAIGFTFATAPWGFVFGVIYGVALHNPIGAAGLLLSGVLGMASPVVLRWSRSVTLITNYVPVIALSVMSLCAWSNGERPNAILMWISTVPLMAAVLGGRRAGIRWTIASALTVLAFLALNLLGLVREAPFSEQADRVLTATGTAALAVLFGAYALLYEGFKDSALEEVRREKQTIVLLHRKLTDASRLAGMAEVAADILHNVGNVLTSLNISIGSIRLGIAEMNASRIGRVVQMVEAEPAGFAGLSPEKGAQLLAYLVAYCKANETKRASLMEEVQSLLIDGEQIERVIKAQEELSHASTVVERVDINDEIETTLMLCHDRIAADQIAVVRELGKMAPIEIDRQRLARILVCLIENAGHALEKVAQGERRLTIRAREHGTGVAIEVEDNGVGIPEENLVRVFGFGFSTWPGRRGYGLHASANAAREMGGNLTCRSAGVGRGSTFFLELPLVPRSGSYRLPIAA